VNVLQVHIFTRLGQVIFCRGRALCTRLSGRFMVKFRHIAVFGLRSYRLVIMTQDTPSQLRA